MTELYLVLPHHITDPTVTQVPPTRHTSNIVKGLFLKPRTGVSMALSHSLTHIKPTSLQTIAFHITFPTIFLSIFLSILPTTFLRCHAHSPHHPPRLSHPPIPPPIHHLPP